MGINYRSHICGLVYLVVVGVLTLAGARYTASNYFAQRAIESGSLDDVETAERFDRSSADVSTARGIVLTERKDFSGSADSFKKAIELRPNNYRLWLSLADALLQSGDPESAERAYQRAIELAPAYGLPRMRLGMMLLGVGRIDAAFDSLSLAAGSDPLYHPEVRRLAEGAFGNDADAIERAVAPASKTAKTMFALYLIDRSWMTSTTRAFLLSGDLSPTEKNNFISHLRSKKNYLLAREVWLSRLGPDLAHIASEPIFDGGFELITETDPSGLGWQIAQNLAFTSIARTQKDVHSGSSALTIRFDGNAELQRPIASQFVFLPAGNRYRLTFYVRAGQLTSGGLPALVISDADTNSILAKSDPIADTGSLWAQRSITFPAPANLVAQLSIQRPGCMASPCPIFGEFTIDDISIAAIDP